MLKFWYGLIFTAMVASCCTAVEVNMNATRKTWMQKNLIDSKAIAPFSFTFAGQDSSVLLASFTKKVERNKIDKNRTQQTITWSDPKTGLQVKCIVVEYSDYPTLEWTVYLKNTGTEASPIVESFQAIDTTIKREHNDEFILHHLSGDHCTIDSYTLHNLTLNPKQEQSFASVEGRPTDTAFPYYNIQFDGGGLIAVIGWPGQWAGHFTRDEGTGLRIKAGQELTHFKLLPGEEVRSPLVVLQFYKGDWVEAQNVWRRWMFDHNFPKDHGKPLSPKVGSASVAFNDLHSTQAEDLDFIDRIAKSGLGMDYWWMDAGWYPNSGHWWEVGTWEPDPKRFPDGIKAVSDKCHAHNARVLLWFEPERVHKGSWIATNHPEWVHGNGDDGLLKLDDPSVRQWITDKIDKVITEQGVDLFRSDFNFGPLGFWRNNDAPDRQGITEIRYVEGYLAFWDELHSRHPGMLIDSCASGGRRNDLETMRRAVPLLRSDVEGLPEPNQSQTLGFSLWLPYYDAVHRWSEDPYAFRSAIAPFTQRNWDVRVPNFPFSVASRFMDEWHATAKFHLNDFYPLTGPSTANDVWIAWQFNNPKAGTGLVQAFRRSECEVASQTYRLRRLDSAARYEVMNYDDHSTYKVSGKELMEKGLKVVTTKKPEAVLLTYKKVR
jgi:alpha-galactosidase